MKIQTRFDSMVSRLMPPEPKPVDIRVVRSKRKRIRLRERFNNKRVVTRQVSDEFSLGYGFRVFFKRPGETKDRHGSFRITDHLDVITGKFKIVYRYQHADSLFLQDESDLQILVLMVGKEPITKIFEFVKKEA